MRVTRISIREWRNFRGIEIHLSENTPLVCLAGANGTGKTNILELISAAATHIGLAHGIAIPRGDPFFDAIRDFEIEFYISEGVSDALDTPFSNLQSYAAWDRTIKLDGNSMVLKPGGIEDEEQSSSFAERLKTELSISKDVHHMMLDADRAFPKKNLPAREIASAFATKWDDASHMKEGASHRTSTLYDQWAKYCLAKENKAAQLFYQAVRRGVEDGSGNPEFVDVFGTYRSSLRDVMPHLLFAGADQERREILFDAAGVKLEFSQLSGGEREIAFILGQIDRFGLRNGLFLLDEPELHLNPDLVREWVTHLSNTVSTGQVWLATHSLEALEAAGLDATVLLERNPETNQVDKAGKLNELPLQSTLSRSVGTPAFSITQLRFVFIEGEEALVERERFRRITGLGTDTRFIECGSCNEVIRRVETVRGLAAVSGQPIRIKGIVDRDWRTPKKLREISAVEGVIVLPVHEIENLFLHETTVTAVAEKLGATDFPYFEVLQRACDTRAGGWILQNALSDEDHKDLWDLGHAARGLVQGFTWADIEGQIEGKMSEVSALSGFVDPVKRKLEKRLSVYAKIYQRKRKPDELWKICEGKEVLKVVSRELGLADHHVFERSAASLWEDAEFSLPEEVINLREALSSI